jgi:hypothetical protein
VGATGKKDCERNINEYTRHFPEDSRLPGERREILKAALGALSNKK